MALTILNNIAAIAAENQLNITSNNLNSTLEQLSSGSRINSGADDPAGLAIANGLHANIAALTQSSSNATGRNRRTAGSRRRPVSGHHAA